jgi:hypothetical protein
MAAKSPLISESPDGAADPPNLERTVFVQSVAQTPAAAAREEDLRVRAEIKWLPAAGVVLKLRRIYDYSGL